MFKNCWELMTQAFAHRRFLVVERRSPVNRNTPDLEVQVLKDMAHIHSLPNNHGRRWHHLFGLPKLVLQGPCHPHHDSSSGSVGSSMVLRVRSQPKTQRPSARRPHRRPSQVRVWDHYYEEREPYGASDDLAGGGRKPPPFAAKPASGPPSGWEN